jgi:beta-galactosidase
MSLKKGIDEMRHKIPINFSWYVKPFEKNDLEHIDLKKYQKVDIPNQPIKLFNNYFKIEDIEQKYTYYYPLETKGLSNHKHIYLQFDGVAIESEIYVNQKKAGHHMSGYTPFHLDVTPFLDLDKEVQDIVVVVSGIEKTNVPPFGGVVDYLGYVGIYREVYLDLRDEQYIKDVFMYAENPLETNQLNIEVETTHAVGEILVDVYDIEKKIVKSQTFSLSHESSLLEINLDQKKLWHIDNPYLYEIVLTYKKDDVIYDVYKHKFGFRSLSFESDGFYINGEKRKLLGLNRHQSYPYQGYAMPKGAQKDDADILKRKLGVDVVRSSHYPCSKHFLDRADEIGLLVIEEIPGWQYIGDQTFKEITYLSLKHMIHRDKNHASICMWGVRINESQDDHEFYTKTNEIAKSIDPYRQTGGIRNFEHSELLEDVYTYNDFTKYNEKQAIQDKQKVVKDDVPYLITEHNGHMFPTKPYDNETIRLGQAKRHLKVINDAFAQDNHISGAIGWVMSDYQTHPAFGSADGICYHGVTDINRMPKMASYSYLSQKDHPFVLEVSSQMNIGEYPGGFLDEVYVFTNLDYIKVYKNNQYVSTYKPNKERYPNLKHPPIVINDFIGDVLSEQEKMSKKDAEKVKKIIRYVTENGPKLPLKYKLQMGLLLKKYRMSFDDGVQLFYKYTSGWGNESISYRFEGYKEDVKVKEVVKTHDESFTVELTSSKNEMYIDETYDTLRYEVVAIDQFKQIKAYAFDPVTIDVSGSIELIGPHIQTLISGQLAFWVRSTSKGKGTIKVKIRDQIIEKEVGVR